LMRSRDIQICRYVYRDM